MLGTGVAVPNAITRRLLHFGRPKNDNGPDSASGISSLASQRRGALGHGQDTSIGAPTACAHRGPGLSRLSAECLDGLPLLGQVRRESGL